MNLVTGNEIKFTVNLIEISTGKSVTDLANPETNFPSVFVTLNGVDAGQITLTPLSAVDAVFNDGGIILKNDGRYRIDYAAPADFSGTVSIYGIDDTYEIFAETANVGSINVGSSDEDFSGESYLDLATLGVYFGTKLHSDAWDNATTNQKTKASYEATRIMNQYGYIGIKTDSSQANEWPRTDDEENELGTPTEINSAFAEIVYAFLDGYDPDKAYGNLGITSEGFGPVRTTYNRTALPEHIVAGCPSIAAWRFLKPYLRAAQEVKISRV